MSHNPCNIPLLLRVGCPVSPLQAVWRIIRRLFKTLEELNNNREVLKNANNPGGGRHSSRMLELLWFILPDSPIYSLLSWIARDYGHLFRRIDSPHGGWRWCHTRQTAWSGLTDDCFQSRFYCPLETYLNETFEFPKPEIKCPVLLWVLEGACSFFVFGA